MYIKYIKLFVFGSLGLFALTGACIVYWTLTNAFNAQKLVSAQVAVYKAQAEQQGKPTVIEQYYNTPTK
jgi:hypothetical protein